MFLCIVWHSKTSAALRLSMLCREIVCSHQHCPTMDETKFFLNFFFFNAAVLSYIQASCCDKRRREKKSTLSTEKTKQNKTKKTGEWLIPMLSRNTKGQRVRVWRIGLYIYVWRDTPGSELFGVCCDINWVLKNISSRA